ncbi:RNA polymerase sigma factor [Pseudomonas donghuensis]|uniref:RNA polymerase sigma factor n=1 Tax=Pseudomonas donghuensis TaxID=1163398 RepID=A0AAP0XCA8_9PSED|nr:RNA polymerase sigma factor [Pseudomonas donghuensis]KDO01919.2 RNA polymerase sigma factor [Pseudomonas donghuensis]MCP6693564.1 RNA polymerase sigma factor [Pseudomonas donghuensis]MDF9891624.1 RNA polymerase sigma-70 factor (ECF subfamily) [Pseudomonas vranovensis]UVL25055.1 RNA polymerase sigma factor [Pseudomonas donghuensis]
MAESDLKRLFLKHARTLQGVLTRKVRDPQLAADLVQESFLRLAEQQGHERIDNTPAYLYRTAHNLMIDHVRQQQRRKTDSVPHEALETIVEDRPGLDEHAATEQHMRRLRRALADLPPRTQDVFRLNRLEGMTHAEVARAMDISDSSVQKHLAKALAYVMQCLQEPG